MVAYQLHHGDCLQVMPTLAERSVAMVFADLPYGLPSTSFSWDSPIDLTEFWAALRLRMGNNAAIIATATQPFSSCLVMSNCGMFRYAYAWEKNAATNFFNAKTQPLRNHEDILVFSKGRTTYNPQMTAGVPYSRKRKEASSTHFHLAKRSKSTATNSGMRYPVTVQKFDVVAHGKNTHPTQKPVALLEWLIATYTNPGDTVLDPVMGSGTTGVACANLGRSFIGIEKDATYFAAAEGRIAAAYAAPAPTQGKLAV